MPNELAAKHLIDLSNPISDEVQAVTHCSVVDQNSTPLTVNFKQSWSVCSITVDCTGRQVIYSTKWVSFMQPTVDSTRYRVIYSTPLTVNFKQSWSVCSIAFKYVSTKCRYVQLVNITACFIKPCSMVISSLHINRYNFSMNSFISFLLWVQKKEVEKIPPV